MKRYFLGSLLLLILSGAILLGVGATYRPVSSLWPGEVSLWSAEPVTRTAKSAVAINVIGTQNRYLFGKFIPSTTSTFTITVKAVWGGQGFETTTLTETIAITVTKMYTLITPPYYPAYQVSIVNGAGNLTTTASLVAQ